MGYQNKVSENDLLGRFFIGIPHGSRFSGYYATLEQLFPLLQDEDFNRFHMGYYINSCNNSTGVRLSYFTQENLKEKLIQTVNNFLKKNNLNEINIAEQPHNEILARIYGGQQYELRFRNYLALETQIGIEILKSNPQHAKSLMVTYRWQVFATRSQIQPHLEPACLKYSKTYLSLSDVQRQQFWADVSFWPNPPQVDWAHFLVNLVLSVDWNGLFRQSPFTPLSIIEINEKILPELGFTIDPNWNSSV